MAADEVTPRATPPQRGRRATRWIVAAALALTAAGILWTTRSSVPLATVRVDAYFCQPVDVPAPCAAPATTTERAAAQKAAASLPGVTRVRYVSQREAYLEFIKQFAGQPVTATATEAQLPDSLRITVSSPEAARAVADRLGALAGIASAHAAVPALATLSPLT